MSDESESTGTSRRTFLASGGWFTAAWLVSQWPAISAAAHHADAMAGSGTGSTAPGGLQFFSEAESKDVDALTAQIVPSGATPGARETQAVRFIDRSLATYFAAMAPEFRKGLADFQSHFHAINPGQASFAAAPPDDQIEFLKLTDHTPFFETARMLTVLGMFSSPKYGGNADGNGWRLMGFEDRHAFAPPFGYYDARYEGFVPYGPSAAGDRTG